LTTVFISSLVVIVGISASAVWLIHRAYIHTIDGLRSERKDLLDRLFQSKAMPPSGIDLTQKYEARQEREKEQRENPNRGKRPLGPIEQLTDKWTVDDRAKVERGIDVTKPRNLSGTH